MELKPGSRWRSAVCATEVIVVRAPSRSITLECGGHAMVAQNAEPPSGLVLDAKFSGGTPIGKRFADDDTGLEVLCTKAGEGSLAIDGAPLLLKDAKPLPSSD
jgi:hypothetical protein